MQSLIEMSLIQRKVMVCHSLRGGRHPLSSSIQIECQITGSMRFKGR
jgi:hypothetical protein